MVRIGAMTARRLLAITGLLAATAIVIMIVRGRTHTPATPAPGSPAPSRTSGGKPAVLSAGVEAGTRGAPAGTGSAIPGVGMEARVR